LRFYSEFYSAVFVQIFFNRYVYVVAFINCLFSVWRSGNVIRHIHQVKLRRARY